MAFRQLGRDAITEVARGFMTAFPDMVLTMDDLDASGDHATYHWTLVRHQHRTGWDGETRPHQRIRGMDVRCDGLIAESQGHFDEADYQHQLQHGFDGSQQ